MKFDYLVVAGGVKPSKAFVRELIKNKYVRKTVAVDVGYNVLNSLGVKPDLFVGDGDSLKLRGKLKAKKVIWLMEDKKSSDLEYALKVLPKKSTKLILAAHKEGQRTDHGFVNLILGLKFPNLFFADEKSWLTGLHDEKFSFKTKPETIFSVISPHKVELTVKNALYETKSLKIKDPSHGLSNQTLDQNATSVKVKGRALLFVNQSVFNTKF